MQPGLARSFWERRIQGWDRSRYAGTNPVSWRARSAAARISPVCSGRVVVDLGCGGGRLLELLQSSGARQLIGMDFSPAALQLARVRCSAQHIRFVEGDVVRDELPDGDLYVGLGLLDWLTVEQIGHLFHKLRGRDFLFSFSERRASLLRWMHQLYCWLSFGWRQPGYVPRYFNQQELSRLAQQAGYPPPNLAREARLHFGAFLWSYASHRPL